MRNNGINIRISDIIYGVIKRRLLIILLTVAGLLTGIVLSGISYLRGEMSREYMITTSFSVNMQTQNGLYTSGYDFPDYDDIRMASDLVDSVSYALKSDKMLNEIIDSLGLLGITTTDIGNNLKLTQYNETQIIEMTLYWRSSQEGIEILREINSRAPQVLSETLSIGSVSVINEPNARYVIGGRVNMVLWGYMALIGLALGFGITLLELIIRPTLINVQDIGELYGLDVMCEVAEDKAYFRKGKAILVEEPGERTGEDFASAAHIIQTQLRKKESPHIIYITSSIRGEGKTQMIANLAIRLSDLEKHVLLIDFDMKNPGLGGLFLKKVEYEHSLNALYAGEINESEAVTTLTGYLDILPTVLERNSIPLDSNLFAVIRKLAAGYDYVLIDTAPVGISADPMSLNQIATDALFVIRYDLASLQEIHDALERIRKSGIGILGCIVNGVKVSEREINNPVTENAKVKRAQRREENRKTAPVTAAGETAFMAGRPEKKEGTQSLLAGFAEPEEESGPVMEQEVTTGSGFIERLFEAEDNRKPEPGAHQPEAEEPFQPVLQEEPDQKTETEQDTFIWQSISAEELPEEDETAAPKKKMDEAEEREQDPVNAAEDMEETGYRQPEKAEWPDEEEKAEEADSPAPDPGYAEIAADSIGQAQRRMEDLLKELDDF